jgi:hypothetical protein
MCERLVAPGKGGLPVAGGVLVLFQNLFTFCSPIARSSCGICPASLQANCKLDHAVLLSCCNLSINSDSILLLSVLIVSSFT